MYLKEGFANFHVGEPRINLSENKKEIELTIVLEEGERYKVADITYEGYENVELEKLREATELQTGDWFDIEKYQSDVKKITSQFTSRGYAYANVEPQTVFKNEARTVSINYKIEENQLVYINRINIRGNTKSRDRVIRREFDLTEETFTAVLLSLHQKDIWNLPITSAR